MDCLCEAKLRSSGEKKENFFAQWVSVLTPDIGCAVNFNLREKMATRHNVKHVHRYIIYSITHNTQISRL